MLHTYFAAGLTFQMDTWGRTLARSAPYRTHDAEHVDFVIHSDVESLKKVAPHLDDDICEYMATGADFYVQLLKRNGMLLHSSAIVMDGKAYLFSAPSGTGKSTHTSLWIQQFGSEHVFYLNDDKPALRREDRGWFAYGTPWSGKHDLNVNMGFPVGGIAVLSRSETNSICRMDEPDAAFHILDQTQRPRSRSLRTLLLDRVSELVAEVPVWSLCCNMDPDAAQVAYDAMSSV